MATTRVQLPDGNIGEFPATMKPEEIEAVLAKQYPPESAAPGVPKAPAPQMQESTAGKMYGAFHPEGGPAIDRWLAPTMHDPSQGVGGNLITGLSNIGASGLHLLTHPEELVTGAVKSSIPVMAYQGMRDAVKHIQGEPNATDERLAHPVQNALQTAEGAIGQAGALGLPEMASEGMTAVRPYRSPIVPSAETAAEKLAKAILPPEGVTPNLLKSIQREAPHVREYAMRTNNPLRTIQEGTKAAEGVANEGLQNYRTNFLEPNAGERVTLENGVSQELGHTATLAQIEKRISDINDLTRGAMRTAKSGGAEMTALERQGLEQEGQALRQKLYGRLAEKTGTQPEDIQAMREGYGGQYSLKNALESGHMQRLTNVGRASQGGGSGIYPTKAGIVDKTITMLRGGPERIANRQFRNRMAAFEPEAPQYMSPTSPQPQGFQPAQMSRDVLDRINAVGTDEGVQPRPQAPPPNLSGPMQRAPLVAESQRVSQEFNEGLNAAERARRAGNIAASSARKPAGLGPSERLSPALESPDPQLRRMAEGQAQRTGSITQQRELNRLENMSEEERRAANYATRGRRLANIVRNKEQ